MPRGDIGEWLRCVASQDGMFWWKRLTPNELGLTGAHQAGVVVPREVLRTVFGEMVRRTEKGEHNPDRHLPAMIWPAGIRRTLRLVYYNGRPLGAGTRDEARLTGWGNALGPVENGRIMGMFVPRAGDDVEVWFSRCEEDDEALMNRQKEGRATGGNTAGGAGSTPRDFGTSGIEEDGGDTVRRRGGSDEEPDGGEGEAGSRGGWGSAVTSSAVNRRRYPRLFRTEAVRLATEWKSAAMAEARRTDPLEKGDPLVAKGSWVPGGRAALVSVEELGSIRDAMLECRSEAGISGGQSARRRFDLLAAQWWADNRERMPLREGHDPGVWSWLCAVLVPEVVAWRFPDCHYSRFVGGPRNALQRLWLRGIVLDRANDQGYEGEGDRWLLLKKLTEDAMVQIFERPALAANARVARVLAEVWCECSEEYGLSAMEDLHRRAMKAMRAESLVVSLDFLAGRGDLKRLARTCFDRAARREVE